MKKIFLLLIVLAGFNSFGQVLIPTSTVTPTQLTAGNGTVAIKNGTVGVTSSTVSLLPVLLTNTTTAMKKGVDTLNQSARLTNSYLKDGPGNTAISRLNDIYSTVYASDAMLSNIYFNGVIGNAVYSARLNRKLDSLTNYTRYNNNKQDSMIAGQMYTVMNLTLTSAGNGTAVVAGQTIGDGTYSITIPTGNWQIVSAVVSASLQGASGTMRMFVFSGSSNIPTQAEGSTYSVGSIDALTELTSVYVTSTTNYVSVLYGSTGSFQPFNILNTAGIQSDGRVYPSGTLKLGFTYGSNYTPTANNRYFVRIRLKRVN